MRKGTTLGRGIVIFLQMILTVILEVTLSHAHNMNASFTTIIVKADSLQAAFAFNLTDLEKYFSLDTDGDQIVTYKESLAGMPVMYKYVEEHIVLTVDTLPVKLEQREGRFRQDDAGHVFAYFIFGKKLDEPPVELSLTVDFFEKFGADHKSLAKIVVGDKIQQAIFSQENPHQRFVIGEKVPLLAQIGKFIKLGIEHIFLGYDHLMFLFALIVIGGRFRSLIKIVTAFTVAHSITLILAALQVVTLPSRWIESGIALSIAYVACENFFVTQANHRWILTFFFGLVHGFGFANVLRDLGLPTRGLVPSLLAFNVGVEIGQICIVAVFFPITLWIAKQKFQRKVVFALSSVILLFGLGWLVERAFSLSFMPL